MRAKLPKGLGTWPAFWLMGVPQLVEPKDKKTIPQIEIDVVEQYGVGPNALHTTLHLWGPGKYHWAEGDTSIVAGMTDDFHTYGVSVEDDFTTFYFDGARCAATRRRRGEGSALPDGRPRVGRGLADRPDARTRRSCWSTTSGLTARSEWRSTDSGRSRVDLAPNRRKIESAVVPMPIAIEAEVAPCRLYRSTVII